MSEFICWLFAFFLCSAQRCSPPGKTMGQILERIHIHLKKTKAKQSPQCHHAKRWNSTSAPTKGETLFGNNKNLPGAFKCAHFGFKTFPRAQPKARTSSEESMASEDDRSRKHSSLNIPTPLIRTSSGTHVRPKPHPRGSRHSGELPQRPLMNTWQSTWASLIQKY